MGVLSRMRTRPLAKTMLAIPLLSAALACGGSSPSAPTVPPTGGGPTAVPSSAPSPLAATLRSAVIRGANGHAASGTARVVSEGGAHFLELGEDFRIDSGNNDVYLTRAPGTRTESDLNLGNMRALTGAQRYALPDAATGYAYVMLWCRPFQVAIGLGELR